MRKARLHARMEPAATSQLMVAAVEAPALEAEQFESVVRQYWPRVFLFVLASLRDRDAAETVTQDCFLRAYRGLGGFRGEASLQTWLMQIAVNLVRDYARNRRLQFWRKTQAAKIDVGDVSDWMPDRDATPEEKALTKERVAAVWEVAGTLSPKQRTVFLLRFVEDMDLLEICGATGLKEGAVKVHLFRALKAVRERIGRAV